MDQQDISRDFTELKSMQIWTVVQLRHSWRNTR